MSSPLREQILQTATGLFYSRGIKATGVDAIVKAAGTTKMSLYKYFPSKDDLVLAYLRERAEEMRRWLVKEIEQQGADPAGKLLAVFDVFAKLLASPDFRGCPFINASAEFAAEDDPVHRVSVEFYGSFRGLLAELARRAGAPEAEILARQLALLIAGATVSEQMQRNSGAIAVARRAAEILIDHSLRGGPSSGKPAG